MNIWKENGITVIQADTDKYLQKDEVYSQEPIYLGKFDSPENWEEVEERPEEGG